MSKQSRPTGNRARPKPTIFYLDRNLCCDEIIQPLRDAGYNLRTYFEEFGRIHGQQIPDREIIRRCGERNEILITADRKLEFTYAPEILAARARVIILLTNNDGAQSWLKRLISAHDSLKRQVSLRRKPFAIRVALDGTLTIVKLYRKSGTQSIQLY